MGFRVYLAWLRKFVLSSLKSLFITAPQLGVSTDKVP